MDDRDLVSLKVAAEWLPRRRGQQTGVQTLATWVETGSKGVRLKAVRSGGQWFTCREWVEAFLRERG